MNKFVAFDVNGDTQEGQTISEAFNNFLNNHSTSPDYIFTKFEVLQAEKRMKQYQASEVWKK